MSLLMHICVTQPQWVNSHGYKQHKLIMKSCMIILWLSASWLYLIFRITIKFLVIVWCKIFIWLKHQIMIPFISCLIWQPGLCYYMYMMDYCCEKTNLSVEKKPMGCWPPKRNISYLLDSVGLLVLTWYLCYLIWFIALVELLALQSALKCPLPKLKMSQVPCYHMACQVRLGFVSFKQEDRYL